MSELKVIWVKEKTHRKIKMKAAKEGKTINGIIEDMFNEKENS